MHLPLSLMAVMDRRSIRRIICNEYDPYSPHFMLRLECKIILGAGWSYGSEIL